MSVGRETVAGREPNNLMVEFRVFNVTKKIEVVYRLRKKAVTDPEAVYIAFPFEVEGGKIHLDAAVFKEKEHSEIVAKRQNKQYCLSSASSVLRCFIHAACDHIVHRD